MKLSFLLSFLVCSIIIIVVVSSTPTTPSLPKFPQSFTVVEADDMEIFQGQYTNNGDSVCCSEDSNCEVQTEYQAGNNYVDEKNQRTRFDQS